MQRHPICSRRDPDRPEPWADLDLVDGSLTIAVRELNGFTAAKEIAAARAGEALDAAELNALKGRERPEVTSETLQLSTDTTAPEGGGLPPAEQVHVLAVTLDGDLEFVPESQQASVYYAHLAWYEPATGEWTAFEFIDPTDGK